MPEKLSLKNAVFYKSKIQELLPNMNVTIHSLTEGKDEFGIQIAKPQNYSGIRFLNLDSLDAFLWGIKEKIENDKLEIQKYANTICVCDNTNNCSKFEQGELG